MDELKTISSQSLRIRHEIKSFEKKFGVSEIHFLFSYQRKLFATSFNTQAILMTDRIHPRKTGTSFAYDNYVTEKARIC